jgi:hypothetical protein
VAAGIGVADEGVRREAGEAVVEVSCRHLVPRQLSKLLI